MMMLMGFNVLTCFTIVNCDYGNDDDADVIGIN